MGADVFSGKRKSYGDYERELLVSKVDVLESSVANLQSMESIPVHGSGTTNPSKFFWKLMDTLEERSRIHLSMSYRAVGSGTGIKEFVGATNDYEPYSHFGSGDIVVPSEDYTALNDRQRLRDDSVPTRHDFFLSQRSRRSGWQSVGLTTVHFGEDFYSKNHNLGPRGHFDSNPGFHLRRVKQSPSFDAFTVLLRRR